MLPTLLAQIIRGGDVQNVPKVAGNGAAIDNAVDAVFFIAGALTVIFLIIAAIKYTISQGDSRKIAEAKDSILYALAGMVVVALAFAIVQFTIGTVQGG